MFSIWLSCLDGEFLALCDETNPMHDARIWLHAALKRRGTDVHGAQHSGARCAVLVYQCLRGALRNGHAATSILKRGKASFRENAFFFFR